MDTYILQKNIDTPDKSIPAGAEFYKDPHSLFYTSDEGGRFADSIVENDSTWFKKKEQCDSFEDVKKRDQFAMGKNLTADELMPKTKLDILFESRKEYKDDEGSVVYMFTLDWELKKVPAYWMYKSMWDSMQKKSSHNLNPKYMNFGAAIEALKNGKLVFRTGWNGTGMFIVKQIPAVIGIDIIPKMQSLPQSAKDHLLKREQAISYTNQMLIINADGRADSWVPSSSDCFAEDWEIVE